MNSHEALSVEAAIWKVIATFIFKDILEIFFYEWIVSWFQAFIHIIPVRKQTPSHLQQSSAFFPP